MSRWLRVPCFVVVTGLMYYALPTANSANGTAVDASVASSLIGGACNNYKETNCSSWGCGTQQAKCADSSSALRCTIQGDACDQEGCGCFWSTNGCDG
jgi:hypothetical protein